MHPRIAGDRLDTRVLDPCRRDIEQDELGDLALLAAPVVAPCG
jgi:hypothetical protein